MSLVELLIASFITSLILSLVLYQYVSVYRQHQHIQHKFTQTMEVNYIVELIRESIRAAGFTPCISINHLITNPKLSAITANASEIKILRMDNNVAVRRVSPHGEIFADIIDLHIGDKILIADCNHAEVQYINNVSRMQAASLHKSHELLIVTKAPLAFSYTRPIFVGLLREESFFTRSDKPGLFYRDNHTDEISSIVTKLSTLINYPLVNINLQLDDGENVSFVTRLRMP